MRLFVALVSLAAVAPSQEPPAIRVDVNLVNVAFAVRDAHGALAAGEKFFQDVLAPRDRAFLVCFGDHLRLVSDFSFASAPLMEGLKRFDKGDRRFLELGPVEDRELGIAFYDALYYAVTDKLAKSEGGRRALIVFSDGEDNSSAHHMMDAIEAAQLADAHLFCLRYTERKHGRFTARNKYGMRVMERIARETKGRRFRRRAG
jgi:Ca-activated chloride channel family protein